MFITIAYCIEYYQGKAFILPSIPADYCVGFNTLAQAIQHCRTYPAEWIACDIWDSNGRQYLPTMV